MLGAGTPSSALTATIPGRQFLSVSIAYCSSGCMHLMFTVAKMLHLNSRNRIFSLYPRFFTTVSVLWLKAANQNFQGKLVCELKPLLIQNNQEGLQLSQVYPCFWLWSNMGYFQTSFASKRKKGAWLLIP